MKKQLLYLLTTIVFASCSIKYSMIDTNIDADTFSIEIFEEQAPNAPAGYGATFTDYLKDYMISRTKLDLKNENADIEIFGKIYYYDTSPISVQADDIAALTRLTVRVSVTVINNINEEQSFESTFSQNSDFDANQDLSSVQDELIKDVNGKLSQDIINKLTSNW